MEQGFEFFLKVLNIFSKYTEIANRNFYFYEYNLKWYVFGNDFGT